MAFFDGAVKAPKTRNTHMTFRLKDQLYGIPLDMVSHVVALEGMLPLKASDPAVVGELELMGGAAVVLDMGVRLLGKPIKDTSGKCVVIVKRSQARSGCLFDAPQGLACIPEGEIEACGLLADDVEGVRAIPEDGITPAEDASTSGETKGYPLYRSKSETILLPDPETFFPI